MPFLGVAQREAVFASQAVAVPETYNAGDMTVTANVSVVYELNE